jgi:hypothetical protein
MGKETRPSTTVQVLGAQGNSVEWSIDKYTLLLFFSIFSSESQGLAEKERNKLPRYKQWDLSRIIEVFCLFGFFFSILQTAKLTCHF